MPCSKCKIANTKAFYKCDLCQNTFCNECAQLTSTEDRCMNLSKKRLKYLCDQCDEKLLDSQKLLEENLKLKEQIIQLTKRESNAKDNEPKNVHIINISEKMDHIENIINEKITQVKTELEDFKESNKQMVRLLTEAPPSVNLKASSRIGQPKSYADTVKRTTTEGNEHIMSGTNKTINKNKNIGQRPATPNERTQRTEHQVTCNSQEVHKNSDTEGGYQRNKRRWRKTVQFGTNEETENEFEGQPAVNTKDKKIWLFISKVRDTVSAENVTTYIKKKTNLEEEKISVKKLDTWHKVEDNKCFLIGIDPAYKESVYSASFWPKGVAYERFNFFKGQRFLDNQKTTNDKGDGIRDETTIQCNGSFLTPI